MAYLWRIEAQRDGGERQQQRFILAAEGREWGQQVQYRGLQRLGAARREEAPANQDAGMEPALLCSSGRQVTPADHDAGVEPALAAPADQDAGVEPALVNVFTLALHCWEAGEGMGAGMGGKFKVAIAGCDCP
eukprot:1161274-Pelagomonas_calceolata.AAC.5